MAQRKKDKARQWTDKKLEDMEAKIAGIYKKSTKDIVKKWNSYMEKTGKKIAGYQEAYNKALASNDADAISEAYDALYKAKYNQTLGSEYYQDMVSATTAKLAQVNQLAVSYANNQMPSVYMQNFNFTSAGTHKLLLNNGIQFNLIDEATVKRRITDGDIKLPKKKVDIPKDKRWNTKQLNSAVTQGIIQGESMKDIAKRILPVVDNNEKAAIRNTRTMVTGAECQGRVDRYKDLQKRGAIIKKVWMATADSRTRDWHLSMDGQEKELDENFIDGNGDEVEYPGDPSAEPKTVYNCRCAIASHILGFRKADGHIDWIDEDETDQDTFHEEQIEAEQERRATSASTKGETEHKVVNGTDISNTWTRRADQFEFEIDDVINAQGFDGLPRVVSAEEFDEYVKQANDGKGFIAQRTYSAPNQETLDTYRDMLYNGKWYVDCSEGGAQYGQGMYCAADYTGKITDGIKNEMSHYGDLGLSRNDSAAKELAFQKVWDDALQSANDEEKALIKREFLLNATDEERHLARAFEKRDEDAYDALVDKYAAIAQKAKSASESAEAKSYTETLTLDPSAKVITYKDLQYKKEMQVDKLKYRDMDDGSFAVLLGYDAINVEGHGESGSYTVILNRTKLIIKGE